MVLSIVGLCVLLVVGVFAPVERPALEWTDENFDANLASAVGGKAFVMFFAPWCGHCKAMKPVWDVMSDGTSSTLAAIVKVDCTDKGQALCKKYNVGGYPTIKLFTYTESGVPNVVDYDGGRTLENLEVFLLENTRPALVELVTDEELSTFVISTHLPAVVGYFANEKSVLLEKLQLLSGRFRRSFQLGYTLSEQFSQKMGQKSDVVVLYWPIHYHTKMEPDSVSIVEAEELEAFLNSHKKPIVALRNPSNEVEFSYPLVTAYIEVDPMHQKSSLRQLRNRIITVSRKHPTVQFAISTHSDYSDLINELRNTYNDTAIYLIGYDQQRRKVVSPNDFSTYDSTGFQAGLDQFVVDFLKGDVYKPYFKSEAVPTSNDTPVKVIVGSTFEEMVLNNDKDVFIEFYAPWCGHCKKLQPIYDSLGALLTEEQDHLIIAQIDATANEYPPYFSVRGFPTIFLVKAGQKDKPVTFEGERNLQGFVEFLRKHSSQPLKFQGKLPEPLKEEL